MGFEVLRLTNDEVLYELETVINNNQQKLSRLTR